MHKSKLHDNGKVHVAQQFYALISGFIALLLGDSFCPIETLHLCYKECYKDTSLIRNQSGEAKKKILGVVSGDELKDLKILEYTTRI